jgi:hypothetical protein
MKEMAKLPLTNRRSDLISIPGKSAPWQRDGAIRKKVGLLRDRLKVHYGSDLLIAATLIVGLNVLDAFFTMIILDQGGREVNPIVKAAMDAWGERFWIWKFVMVSSNICLLCLCSHLKYVKASIFGICFLYTALIMYQVVLLNNLQWY